MSFRNRVKFLVLFFEEVFCVIEKLVKRIGLKEDGNI